MTLAFDEHCGAGATVVCLPMFGASRLMTAAALRPALAGAGLRELYVDIPGHGDSVRSHEATSQAVLDAVAGFIDKHSVESVLVAGCSYGGYLAAGLARLRPELVRALLLVCPGVVTAPEARPQRPGRQTGRRSPRMVSYPRGTFEVAAEFLRRGVEPPRLAWHVGPLRGESSYRGLVGCCDRPHSDRAAGHESSQCAAGALVRSVGREFDLVAAVRCSWTPSSSERGVLALGCSVESRPVGE